MSSSSCTTTELSPTTNFHFLQNWKETTPKGHFRLKWALGWYRQHGTSDALRPKPQQHLRVLTWVCSFVIDDTTCLRAYELSWWWWWWCLAGARQNFHLPLLERSRSSREYGRRLMQQANDGYHKQQAITTNSGLVARAEMGKKMMAALFLSITPDTRRKLWVKARFPLYVKAVLLLPLTERKTNKRQLIPLIFARSISGTQKFISTHDRHNIYFKLHVHGHINFYRRPWLQVMHHCFTGTR